MTQIAILDEAASNLASAAASMGRSQEELASMLILEGLREKEDAALSAELESLLLHRIQQSEHGESVSSEEVNAKFEAFYQELEAH